MVVTAEVAEDDEAASRIGRRFACVSCGEGGGGQLLVSIYKPAESTYKLMIYKYGVFRLSFSSTQWLDREADGTFLRFGFFTCILRTKLLLMRIVLSLIESTYKFWSGGHYVLSIKTPTLRPSISHIISPIKYRYRHNVLPPATFAYHAIHIIYRLLI